MYITPRKLLILTISIFNFILCSDIIGAKLPPGFVEERIVDNLDPTAIALAPDGRIFIAEKNGRVLILREKRLLENPFVSIEVDNYNERGLSGMAIHPDFEKNGYVYLFYTVPEENLNRITRVKANGDLAIPGSEEVILVLDKLSGTIHNGGAMHFDQDKKLYIAVGDGSQGGNGQNLESLLGKILRINDDGSIPVDNPFYSILEGDNRAIWAYGFRNPFTMAIQPGSGKIYANDVGRDQWEEVNEIIKGGNYGWNLLTGKSNDPVLPEDYINPVYTYDHSIGCSVIGAAFYNPEKSNFPKEYIGNYFFADYCQGYIKRIDPATGALLGQFASNINRPVQLLVSPDGELYYLERNGIGGGSMVDNTSTDNGVLWRIYYTGDGSPLISLSPSSILLSVGDDAGFNVTANGVEPLDYQWLKNGIALPGHNAPELTVFNVQIKDNGTQYQCIVSNELGSDTSDVAILSVTENSRPEPLILLPVEGQKYTAGDTVYFKGQADDFEDGIIAKLFFRWKIDFHHDEHTHPALNPTVGIDSGTYVIPKVGEIDDDVWYRIYLTVFDSGGLSQTVYRDLYPIKTNFRVESVPEGLEINVDGRLETTPVSLKSVVGILRTLQAIGFQNLQGRNYVFRNWSDGEQNKLFSFFAEPINITYKATFEEIPKGQGVGLLGEYFYSEDQTFDTKPQVVRIDPEINFNWGEGSPEPGVLSADYFTIRWTGFIEPLSSAEYSFYTNTDDGVRLWIDNELLIDQWSHQAATELRSSIYLEEAEIYPIRMEYFEAGGAAVAELRWKNPEIKKQIVPQAQLYPGNIENPYSSFNLSIKPNPADDYLQLEFHSDKGGSAKLMINDINGKLIINRQLSFLPGTSTYQLDVSTLIPGIYLLIVKNESAEDILEFLKK